MSCSCDNKNCENSCGSSVEESKQVLRDFLRNVKVVATPAYNYKFNTETGYMERFGKTVDDDPLYSPIGPEILDMEISTICNGINGVPCRHCYKTNTGKGINMPFETFKNIFDKMPMVTQIAFGIGDITSHPRLFDILQYCRDNGNVIPNLTTNGWGMTEELAKKFSNVCGAIAVSRYSDADVCYNAVKLLTDAGMDQINIHMMVAEETKDTIWQLLEDVKTDPRLEKLHCIVFLTYKPKGRGKINNYNSLDFLEYKKIVDHSLENNINIGFDSCGAPLFIEAIKDHPEKDQIMPLVECCESSLFSAYINVNGYYFPCSFVEGEGDWKYGIDVLRTNDFIGDVWFHEKTKQFRKSLTSQGINRKCPYFAIYGSWCHDINKK